MNRRAALVGMASLLMRGQSAADISGGGTDPADVDRNIGTMLMMGFRGGSLGDERVRAVAGQIASGQIGGVILFDDNLESPTAAQKLIHGLREASKAAIPLIGVDQEGGVVSRLRPERSFPSLPPARAVGQMTTAETAQVYDATARELHDLGFNVNFGPVVDLDINPRNPIIGGLGRSFGADPQVVVDHARVFIEAHRRHHVLTALKHFPGHGSSVQDSHRVLPDISETWREIELKPFAELIASGFADMVMIGHLVNRTLTEPGRPASLSNRAIHTLLRKQMGFNGVVVSDDMQMGALRRTYPPDESIVLGINAGLDLFVYSNREHPDPDMPGRFHRVVKQSIADGSISPYRIAESAQRITNLKQSIA